MEKRRFLTGDQIKLFACVSMAVDHVGLNFFKGTELYRPMRFFGRLAFPLYLFLLAEGAVHTKDRVKYLGRLFVFALISEIPFDLGVKGAFFVPEKQNVYWTLFFALISIFALQELLEAPDSRDRVIISCSMILVCISLADFMHTDYGALGIAAGLLVYMFRSSPGVAQALSCLVLLCSSWWEFTVLANYPIVAAYNGRRGNSPGWLKWFFYAFYPLHFLIIWGVKQWTG